MTTGRCLVHVSMGTGPCLDAPNFVPGPLQITNPRKQNLASGQNPYFNTSLFSVENLGELGTSNRRFFHGPGINNFDMALVKNLRLTESKTLELQLNSSTSSIMLSLALPKEASTAQPSAL